jgi:hypothetical protein
MWCGSRTGTAGKGRRPSEMKGAAMGAVLLLLALPAHAQTAPAESDPPAPATPKPESALVRAARDSKAARDAHPSTTPRKVITNADVKRSTGKVVFGGKTVTIGPRKPAAAAAKSGPKAEPAKSSLEKQDAQHHARIAATERVGAAEKKVGDLERSARSLEQAYYDENDANVRDTVLRKRFEQTKRQLDDARQELANARDALTEVDKP